MTKHLQRTIGRLMRICLLFALFCFSAPPDLLAQNNALYFDGNNDYVDCGTFTPTSFTVEAWVNPNRVNADQAIVSTLTTVANTGFEMHIGDDGVPLITLRDGSNWIDTKGTDAVSTGQWFHMAMTFDGTTCKVFVNGIQTASNSISAFTPGAGNLNIGRRTNNEKYFYGKIDEVRVWNTARTQTEIVTSMSTSLAGAETGLVRYYAFNQGTAVGDNSSLTTLTDATSNTDGTLTNFALTGTTSNWVEGYNTNDVTNIITASPTAVSIESTSGSTATFTITSNTTWNITGTADWFLLDATTGTGNKTITVTATQANETNEARSVELTLSGTDTENSNVTITQENATIDFSKTKVYIGKPAGSQASLSLTTDVAWTATCSDTWLTVSSLSGTGDVTLTLTAEALPEGSTGRTATISFAGLFDAATVQVIQSGNNALHFDNGANKVDIGALVDGSPDFSEGFTFAGWVKFDSFNDLARIFTFAESSTSSTNNLMLCASGTTGLLMAEVNVAKVTTTTPLETNRWYYISFTVTSAGYATIYVNGIPYASKTLTAPANVIRNTCYLGNSNYNESKGLNGSLDEVTIWNKALTQSEIIAGMQNSFIGTEAGLAIYYKFNQGTAFDDNSSVTNLTDATADAITGILTNFSLTGTTSNWVEGYNTNDITYNLTASPAQVSIERASSSTATFTIASNTTWSIVDADDWLDLDVTSGTGNASITLTANETNTTDATRSIELVITGTNAVNDTVTVTQQRGTISVSAAEVQVNASVGSTATFDITSNTDWTITESCDWFSVSTVSGTGNASITVTSDLLNSSSQRRSAVMVIAGTNAVNDTVTITQKAATIALSRTTIDINADANSQGFIGITTDVDWQATCPASWLNLDKTSGTGNDAMAITAEALPDGVTERYANIVFSGVFEPTGVIVTQKALPNNALHFDGSDDYVVCNPVAPSQFTAEAWIYLADASESNDIISNFYSWQNFILRVQSNHLRLILGKSNTFNYLISEYTFENNKWYHVAATYDGSVAKLYINGVQDPKTLSASLVTNDNAPLYIGTEPGNNFSGKIDDVRLWSMARSADEIKSDLNNQTTDNTGLLAWFNFNQGMANGNNTGITTLYDASGNMNDGTLYNFDLTGTTSNWVEGTSGKLLLANVATSSLTAEAGSIPVSVQSNTNWTVISNASWLTADVTTGNGDATVTLAYTANSSSYLERTATLAFAAEGIDTVTITFAQQSEIVLAADFSADKTTANIIPATIAFTDASTVTNTSMTNWAWDFGDGSTSTEQNPEHTYTHCGNYTVTHIVSDGSFTDTLIKTNYINVSNDVIMANGSVTVSDSLYFYDSGGESNPYADQENYTMVFYPSTPGAFVKLDFISYSTEDGWDRLEIYNDVRLSMTLLATQQGDTYITPIQATNADGALCVYFHSDISTTYDGWKALVSQVLPKASFTASDTSVIINSDVTFTDASIIAGLNSWAWDFGDGNTSTDQNPSHAYTTAGTYTVTLTSSNGAVSKTATREIQVLDATIAGFTVDKTSGYQPTVQFANSSLGATSYSWNFGDGSEVSSDENPTHTFYTKGTYTVTLTATDANSNSSQYTMEITANTIAPAFSANITEGYQPTVLFTDATPGATSWSWDFGDGSEVSTEQNPSHTYTTAGVYTVSLTASDGYNTEIQVKENYITSKLYNVLFSADITVGYLPTVSFTDQTNVTDIISWAWDFGDGCTSTEQNPLHTYTTVGVYTVSLTVSDGTNSGTTIKQNYICTDRILMSNQSATIEDGMVIPFYDSGNSNVNYQDSENYTLVLYPSEEGKAVQIDFSSFETEECCDYLNIYDGTSINATLLAAQKGKTYTAIVTATNANGALCLNFHSDGSIVKNGWEALIRQVDLPSVITWPVPVSSVYGNAFGTGVMNATANIPGTFTYSFTADSVFNAGTHVLTVSFTPTNSIYSATSKTVSYTVTKAQLLATADNVTLEAGSAIPVLTFTYLGFVNGDNADDLDLAPKAATTATSTSSAGNYNIYVLAGFDNNYELTYQQGTLTLTELQVPVITWDNPDEITYGTALSATQLNATTTVEGTFSYSPAEGLVLNAGNAQALNVTFVPTDGTTYASASKTVTINVGKAALTASADNLSRAYGNSNPELTITYNGFVNGDNASVLDMAPVTSTSGNTNSIVGEYAIDISKGFDKNYNITSNAAILSVSARTLTISNFTADSKEYDGTTNVNGTGFSDDRISGDDLYVTFDVAFATKTVGTNKTVDYTNIAISGADAGNYSLASTTGTASANITAKQVTIGGSFVASNKVYDATTAASFETNSLTLLGAIVGDDVSLDALVAFEQSNVGTGLNVLLTNGTTLTGTDAANYSLSFDGVPTSSASITPASLTITGLQADDKVYNGSLQATLSGGVLTGVIGTDQVFTGMPFTGTFAQSSVGVDIPVSVNGFIIEGEDAGNYELVHPNYMTADITPRALILYNFTANNKVYDGTTTFTGTGFSDDRVSGDELTFTYDAAFDTKTVGTYKNVNYTNIAISGGADAGNYSLVSTTGEATANITAKEVTVTGLVAANKVYDSTTDAVLSGGTINGVIDGDDVALTNATNGTFAQATAGTSVAVETNISLSGNDAGNYTLVQPFGVTADITPASLTVTANSIIKTKGQTYTFSGAEFTTSAMYGSDAVSSVTLVSDGTLASAAEGDYPITASNAVGNGLGNYSVTYAEGTLTVTAKQLPVVTWNTPASITYGTALSSDQLNATANVAGTFTYSPAIGSVLNAGNSQILSVTFTPNDESAYAEVTQTTIISVAKANLTVTADNKSVTVGSSIPPLTFHYDGFVNGDDENDLNVLPTITTSANSESPAGEYAITVSGGSDNNYQLSYVDGTLYIIENSSLSVSTDELTIGAAVNSTADFTITSNVAWTISSSENWLSISSASGTGDAAITLSAEANPSTTERTATITVIGSGVDAKTITVTQSAAVGISDNTLSTVKVYPNPASELINVQLPDGLENVTIELLSINGVRLRVVEASGNVTPINVSTLAKGFYMFRITSASTSKIVRWIKN